MSRLINLVELRAQPQERTEKTEGQKENLQDSTSFNTGLKRRKTRLKTPDVLQKSLPVILKRAGHSGINITM